MDDVQHNELVQDMQRTFRRLAGHLSSCNRFSMSAKKCRCGFIQTLLACAYNIEPTGCRGEPGKSYYPVFDPKPMVAVDITAVIADSVRRAAEPKPADYYEWCTQ